MNHLKTANEKIFGVSTDWCLIAWTSADILVSFGADFLETWLSPVEYAWKFKLMPYPCVQEQEQKSIFPDQPRINL